MPPPPNPDSVQQDPQFKNQTQIPLPSKLKLKGDLKVNWEVFKQVWDSYEILTGLEKADSKYRVATFITCLGPEALVTHNGLPFKSPEEKQDMDVILKLWEEHCVGRTNVIYERYKFNNASQGKNDNMDAFLVKLRTLAASCQYGALAEELIRDRIVCGLIDDAVRKVLLQKADLTLSSCVDTVKASEATASQLKGMSKKQEDVHAVKFRRQRKTSNFKASQKSKSTVNSSKKIHNCRYCGGEHARDKEKCPAYGKVCGKCNRPDHFAKKCRNSRRGNGAAAVSLSSTCSSDDAGTDSDFSAYNVDIEYANELCIETNTNMPATQSAHVLYDDENANETCIETNTNMPATQNAHVLYMYDDENVHENDTNADMSIINHVDVTKIHVTDTSVDMPMAYCDDVTQSVDTNLICDPANVQANDDSPVTMVTENTDTDSHMYVVTDNSHVQVQADENVTVTNSNMKMMMLKMLNQLAHVIIMSLRI